MLVSLTIGLITVILLSYATKMSYTLYAIIAISLVIGTAIGVLSAYFAEYFALRRNLMESLQEGPEQAEAELQKYEYQWRQKSQLGQVTGLGFWVAMKGFQRKYLDGNPSA